jgi:hypothetical protein
MGHWIVSGDETVYGLSQVFGGREACSFQGISCQKRKPHLHLVEPAGVRGDVMEVSVLVPRQPNDGFQCAPANAGFAWAGDTVGAIIGPGAAASRANRSALSRSRLAENAFRAISCSVIAFSASTWRNALRASRSALVIGLGRSNSPVVFVISSPSARSRPGVPN